MRISAKGIAKKPIVITIAALVLVFASMLLASTRSESNTDMITINDFLMDTYVTIRVTAEHEDAARDALAEMERLNLIFNRFDASSEVSRVNQDAGQWVTVGPEMIELMLVVEETYEITGGLFDVTVGPLVDAWGLGTDDFSLPDPEELDAALAKVDQRKLQIDAAASQIRLAAEGMSLDLGGVAKGYAIDKAVQVMLDRGVNTALIEVGGDVYVIGQRPGGNPWRIGVQDPRRDGGMLGVLHLQDQAAATSGDYQRYFFDGGIRYHHILHPETGYPPLDVISVSIVASTVVEADILSTAVFLLGVEPGLELLESMEGIEGIIVNSDQEVFITSGLEDGGSPVFQRP